MEHDSKFPNQPHYRPPEEPKQKNSQPQEAADPKSYQPNQYETIAPLGPTSHPAAPVSSYANPMSQEQMYQARQQAFEPSQAQQDTHSGNYRPQTPLKTSAHPGGYQPDHDHGGHPGAYHPSAPPQQPGAPSQQTQHAVPASHTKAMLSMIFGILSVTLLFLIAIPVLGFLLYLCCAGFAITGLILAIQSKKQSASPMGIAGLVLSIIGLVLVGIIFIVFLFAFLVALSM